MPGLFGYVKLDLDGRVDSISGQAVFEGMKRRLCHSAQVVVDEWCEPQIGVRVGRVGPPGPCHTESPCTGPSFEPGSGLCLHGTLHTGAAGTMNLPNLDQAHLGKALVELGGFFAVVGFEQAAPRSCFLAVDRHASRPIFYSVSNRILYFGPEAKALLALDALPRDLDHAAVGSFFSSGYLLDDQTLISSVRRLPGGSYLWVQGGRCIVQRYWRFCPSWQGDGTAVPDLEREFAEEIRSAVGRNFSDPARDAVFLSGGIDSRAILGAAYDQVAQQGSGITAVTWTGGNESPGSDLLTTRALAEDLGLNHLIYARTFDDYGDWVARMAFLLDGSTDIAAFHASELEIMQQLSSAGIRRVLRGDQAFAVRQGITDISGASAEWLRPFSSVPRLQRLFRPEVSGLVGESLSNRLGGLLESQGPDIHPGDLSHILYFENRLQTYLGPAGYFKQLVLDHRNPLMDERLLDLTMRLPIECRIGKSLFRRATKQAFPRVCSVPLASDQVLEDFGRLLSTDSPVRRVVATQIGDSRSPVWDLLDRRAVQEWFDSLPRTGFVTGSSAQRRWIRRVKSVVGSWPGIGRQLRYSYRLKYLPPEDFFLRFLVFKLWFDLSVLGDGSQKSLDDVQSAIRSELR